MKNNLTLSLMMKSHIILFPEILFLSLYLIVYLQAQLLHLVRLFVTPWTVAHLWTKDRLFCPWDSLGKNIGAGCHFLFQGIFPTQESNLCLLHYRWILYQCATWESLTLAAHSDRNLVWSTNEGWICHF